MSFQIPKPDCTSKQSLNSSESFNFSAGSADAAGSITGSKKSHLSSRPRPRLLKTRKKQMQASQDGKTVNGLSGNIDAGGELGNVFGGNNVDLNVNKEHLSNGSGFGVSLNDSLFGLGSGRGKSLFGSSMNSSTSTSQSKDDNYSFVFNKDSSNSYVPKEAGIFVFGACKGDNCESALRVKLDEQGLNKSGLCFSGDDCGKFSSGAFVFGASKNASSMIDSDRQKNDFRETTDVRSKVKLDTSHDSEKVGNPHFQFPVKWSDSSSKNHSNFVFDFDKCDSKFGVDLENGPTGKSSDMPDIGKENTETGFKSPNARFDGVFVFGGMEGKGGFNFGANTEPFKEMNGRKAENCNGFGKCNHNSSSEKFRNSGSSGDSFEKGPAFSILNEMKRLNIGDSKVGAKKTGSFSSNSAVNANNVFVFGGDQKSSGFTKENIPSMSQKTPDDSRFSQNNSESNELNGGSHEVPSTNKDEKESISFRGKLAGLDSSNADYSLPNMKFSFSYNDLFDKLDNANSKSLVGKRLKKGNAKLRQKMVAQKLFSQKRASKESSIQKNHESPGFGSPMDFSHYQDASANNAQKADTGNGVIGEVYTNEKHILENCEMPHDGENSLNFSPSLPAQDGLSEARRQYQKKYKLRVGVSPTDKRINLNAKQEPKGTAPHEVCEHWRIRGNEAYHAGKLSEAEEFYTIGINSVPSLSILYSMKPLLLCYSNRAATRMSLGRMREAIGDCKKASELDSNFLKVTLRAGNCYLVLGEAEDAIQCYTKCLSTGASICLDRKITVEAADGLQKAEKVAEYTHQSVQLLQEGTDDAARNALRNIEEALSISRYSDRLLRRKGEALCILRRYDEVIQLCEQTLDIAEKNFYAEHLDNPESHVKLWRWHLQAKSHYHMGRLELALHLVEKREKMPISSRFGDVSQESSVALAANIHELLSLKRSGNEAFTAGRYTEAIENYTAAISKSFESRAFMAICFCNRAAAHQSLSQIVDAISDCSVAIALDENYPKAISRRATLHEMIRDYKQAVCDLQRLVSVLESRSQINTESRSSGGSAKDLRKARRRLSLLEEKTKKELPLDLYLILGIKASDVELEIKKAYRKAALRHHPDKAAQVLVRSDVGNDGALWKEFGEKIHKDADRLFKIIGEAYAVLSDPSKRSKYDDEEEMRNICRDSNRNNNTGCPSTSYNSPYERGSWSGRQGDFDAAFERNSRRRYWQEARSYSYSHSRW